MKRLRFTFLALSCLIAGQVTYAQDKTPVKFGKITPADFDLSAYKYDSMAEAIVIADVGNSEFEGNSKGWFTLVFRHVWRMKILNKNGFSAATIRIPLYATGNAEEKLDGLKATTYNLENGKVVETKLDDKSVFTDRTSKHWIEKKFTFPAIKEGSVIEYSYVEHSDFLFNLQPWQFQGSYPCLWSEYEVAIPNFLEYVTLGQGFEPFTSNTTSERTINFRLTMPGGAEKDEAYNFDDKVVNHRWVMKNVPALKEERYTTTIGNYVSKIEFQLSRYNFPNTMPKDQMGNWVTVSRDLLKDDDFGADLDRNNGWLSDEIKTLTKGATGPLEKAQKIYAFVRDSFTCTGHGSIYLTHPLKAVFRSRNGNTAELNLLLTAMLAHENIQSDPVILSTRANGFTHEIYPLLSRFNYVICRAIIDSAIYFLDASDPWVGFGHLPEYCYNGHARVVNKDSPVPVYFNADSVMEGKTTLVFFNNGAKGVLEGRVQSVPGYFASRDVREKIHSNGEKEFLKTTQAAYHGEAELSNLNIDSLKIRDKPVGISYDLTYKIDSNEEVIYFNPLLTEGYKENPFASAERKYPVEMSAAMDENYIFNMDIPEGYVVDELPKSAKVLFNDDEGFFEYIVAKDDTGIQLRSRIKLKKANFKPEDYNTLRDFFAYIVKKQAEQIVFKKKK
jgi:uncharacterized protein DUF3858/transglutaminase superfamily protein